MYSFLALRLVCRAGGAEQLYAIKERLQQRDEAKAEVLQGTIKRPINVRSEFIMFEV